MTAIDINLDQPARPITSPRRSPAPRVLAVLLFAVVAGAPQSAAPMLSVARPIPLPSYCTGTPIPGGRLNIVTGDSYVILDAVNGVVVGSGSCPHRPSA